MLKRTAFFAAMLLLAATGRAHGQGVDDSLVVNLKNGQRVAIPLASIQKITFDSVTSGVMQAAPVAPGLQVSPNFPNPSRAGTNIEFSIATGGTVSISIYDSKGYVIRQIGLPSCPAGQNQISWDGLNDRGAPVTSGAYFYEVRFNGETQTKQMVVIK